MNILKLERSFIYIYSIKVSLTNYLILD